MATAEYDWQRFWCPRDGVVNLDQGYLNDPEASWGKIYNPMVARIEKFVHYPCLILLGEPGLGKSFEVKRNEYIISAVGKNDVQNLVVNLSSYDSLDRLEKNVLENDKFKAWCASSEAILYLTLESFDECLIRVETLTNFLLEKFDSFSLERFFLRIVCRTGYWPVALENGLRTFYENNMEILELMPLRRQDVEKAIKKECLDVDVFMEKVFSDGITAFAARPITLRMLINRFKSTGELPKNQVEMYQQGCLSLCDENNTTRRGTKTAGTLTSQQRLIIASRIAAATIFSNKSSLFIAPHFRNIPDGAMSTEDVYGFDEFSGQPLAVDGHSISETIAIGLFSGRGPELMGWAHQTYGEYLAADYLIRHSVDDKRILNLISHPEGKLIPQLYSVAAWIALMNPSIFRIIAENEPKILLLGDIAATTDDQKAALTESYLSHIDKINENINPPAMLGRTE